MLPRPRASWSSPVVGVGGCEVVEAIATAARRSGLPGLDPLARHEERPARDVVDRPLRVLLGEAPLAVPIDGVVGPRRHDLGDDEVVLLAHRRLRVGDALEPGNAALDEGRLDLGRGLLLDAGPLVDLAARLGAHEIDVVDHGDRRHREHELLVAIEELPGERAGRDDDRDLGRLEVDRHGPRGGHDVRVLAVHRARRDERHGTVVGEPIGVLERNRNAHYFFSTWAIACSSEGRNPAGSTWITMSRRPGNAAASLCSSLSTRSWAAWTVRFGSTRRIMSRNVCASSPRVRMLAVPRTPSRSRATFWTSAGSRTARSATTPIPRMTT